MNSIDLKYDKESVGNRWSEKLTGIEQTVPRVQLTGDEYEEKKRSKESELITVEQIPEEQMQKMRAHYAILKKKFPKMKHERICKKVAEYFKLKLV